MITVTGEALFDLVVDSDGQIAAQPGGGPFNTARTMGRLGLAPAFLGRLSQDGFGRILRASLDRDGVTLGVPQLTDAPTTLAAVDVDPAGGRPSTTSTWPAPPRRAGLSGCSRLRSLTAVTALHAGSLALVMEPIATSIERLITRDVPPARAGDDRSQLPPAGDHRPARVPGPAAPASCAGPMWSRSAWKTSATFSPARPRIGGRRPARSGARARPRHRWSSRGPGFPAGAGGSRRCPGGEGRRHYRRRGCVRRGVPGLVVRQASSPGPIFTGPARSAKRSRRPSRSRP
jgi:hypothetical protein